MHALVNRCGLLGDDLHPNVNLGANAAVAVFAPDFLFCTKFVVNPVFHVVCEEAPGCVLGELADCCPGRKKIRGAKRESARKASGT